ncbi:MAG: ATP-binding protein [Ginsengibacter sp.]
MKMFPDIPTPKKASTYLPRSLIYSNLYQYAFNFSFHPNIVAEVVSGKIVLANHAACKLLGYTKLEMLTMTSKVIFRTNEKSFKEMLSERKLVDHSIGHVTMIHKNGNFIPCEVTSAVFADNTEIEKAITTITDISQDLLKQKAIDTQKDKIVADNIVIALAKCNAFLEDRLNEESELKAMQIAEATEDARDLERSVIGRELHDNVNQLLGASQLYLDLAKRDKKKTITYLSRSSEYTITAIEEIRKLTRSLTTDTIKMGLREAIENLVHTTMEIEPMKIYCELIKFSEEGINDKFKLNIFRIVQEHLNNILKHAHASKVSIRLRKNKSSVVMSIYDNGIGFDTSQKSAGIGMGNIKSRAEAFNGTADFVSSPGKGCKLSVAFPATDSMRLTST